VLRWPKMAAVAVGIPCVPGWSHCSVEHFSDGESRPITSPATAAASSNASRTVVTDRAALRQRSTSFVGQEALRQRSTSGAGLEALLAEESQWQQACSAEVPKHPRAYRVCVPASFPGIQYRRSRNLGDRYLRYAQAGSMVYGVEEDGSWLRVSKSVYLPTNVGGRRVLESCPEYTGDPPVPECGGRSEPSSPAKAQLLTVARPSSNWLCASVRGTCDTTPCAVAPCVGMIEVAGFQQIESEAPMRLDDLADDSPLSARSLQPSLPGLPRSAAPCLPTRAPSGDNAVDEAERLLARVVDPFGAMD